jgi:hypothetical protein
MSTGGSTSTGGIGAPLVIEVLAASYPAIPGGRILYTATIGNVSNRAVDAVSLLLRVPTGVQFYYTTDVDPDSSSCGNGTCSADEEAVWSLGSLAAGTIESINCDPTVLSTVAGDGSLIPLRINVTATGVNPIVVSGVIPVYSKPGAQLILGTQGDPVTPGQAFSYDLDVGQIGTTALAGTQLTLDVPTGLTVGTSRDGGTEASPGHIVWSIGTVAVAGTLHRSVAVTTGTTVVAGSILTAKASLSYDGGLEVDAVAEHAVSVLQPRFRSPSASPPPLPRRRLDLVCCTRRPSRIPRHGPSTVSRCGCASRPVCSSITRPTPIPTLHRAETGRAVPMRKLFGPWGAWPPGRFKPSPSIRPWLRQ